MNSLVAPGELHAGDQLLSNNGYFTLEMFANGGLTLYRNQTRKLVWTSPSPSQPGGFAAMQGDGNFVSYAPDGHPYWATNTDGHAGAWLALLDSGDLVVFDAHSQLWHSNTAQNLNTPTIRYVGEGGYGYNETSENWKHMCEAFPCFGALQWPDYASAVIEDAVDEMPIVIQLWKGLCPKFGGPFGLQDFPGGIGAEVGIYRRIPGKVVPTSFLGLSTGGLWQLLNGLGKAAATDLWWAAPELETELWMRLINPITREVVFEAGPEKTYWLTKWMDESDYSRYQREHTAAARYTDYVLEFTVNGKLYHHWPTEPGDLGAVAPAAWLLLLTDDPPQPPPRQHPPHHHPTH